MKKQNRPGEFEIIARYFAPLAEGLPGAFGLLDDAALLAIPEGCRLVVTADATTAGIHFPKDEAADLIARKSLRVNLSDLAAMGASPLAYLLTIALPDEIEAEWLAGFAAGLAADQKEFGLFLAGGDTIRTNGPLTVSVTALGLVDVGRELLRGGARPGDVVFVSGTMGDAALGLAVLAGELKALSARHRDWLVDRYRLPRPRLTLGRRLSGLVHAALDVSDGLVADLGHICTASDVGAEVDIAAVPLSIAARAATDSAPELLERVLAGGDDYEILFTAPPGSAGALAALGTELDLTLTPIGRIVAAETGVSPVRVLAADGAEIALSRGGYAHF